MKKKGNDRDCEQEKSGATVGLTALRIITPDPSRDCEEDKGGRTVKKKSNVGLWVASK